jgi:hypothetical protein
MLIWDQFIETKGNMRRLNEIIIIAWKSERKHWEKIIQIQH